MIFDKIENLEHFLNPKLKNAIGEMYLLIDKGNDGIFQIIEDQVFLKIMTYDTKSEDFITESHKRYVDLQIIFMGEEIVNIYDSDTVKVKEEYDGNTDCIFYDTSLTKNKASILLGRGYFAIFFSEDVHETQIFTNNKISTIKKAVLKIDETFFNTQ